MDNVLDLTQESLTPDELLGKLRAAAAEKRWKSAQFDRRAWGSRQRELDVQPELEKLGRANICFATGFLYFTEKSD